MMENNPGTAPQESEEGQAQQSAQASDDANGPTSEQPFYGPLPATAGPAPQNAQGYTPAAGAYGQYNQYNQYGPQQDPQAPQYGGYGPGVPIPPPASYPDRPYPVQVPAPRQGAGRRTAIIWGLALLAIVGSAAAFAVGGEPAKFMGVGIQFLPFALLAMLAFGGLKNSTAAVFAFVWLVVVDALLAFNVLASVFLAVITDLGKLTAWEMNPQGSSLSDAFKPNAGAALGWTFVLLSLVGIVSFAMLWRPVRVVVARIVPIDPDNFVHKIALSVLTMLLLSSFVPLVVLAGQPPLLEVVNAGGSDVIGDSGLSVRPLDLVYQFAWMIPSTLLAAGWIVSRRFPDVLKRLGMVRPTVVQVVAGVVLGVVFAFVGNYLDQGIQWLWQTLGWGTTDTGAFGELLKGVTNPLGAVVLGITAGVGEEMAVRGLLQPRFGLIASNLVFTSLHAFQYGFDGLLSVFIVGLVLGIIRARSNTSTSAIVHGVYDFVIVIASFYGW